MIRASRAGASVSILSNPMMKNFAVTALDAKAMSAVTTARNPYRNRGNSWGAVCDECMVLPSVVTLLLVNAEQEIITLDNKNTLAKRLQFPNIEVVRSGHI